MATIIVKKDADKVMEANDISQSGGKQILRRFLQGSSALVLGRHVYAVLPDAPGPMKFQAWWPEQVIPQKHLDFFMLDPVLLLSIDVIAGTILVKGIIDEVNKANRIRLAANNRIELKPLGIE